MYSPINSIILLCYFKKDKRVRTIYIFFRVEPCQEINLPFKIKCQAPVQMVSGTLLFHVVSKWTDADLFNNNSDGALAYKYNLCIGLVMATYNNLMSNSSSLYDSSMVRISTASNSNPFERYEGKITMLSLFHIFFFF